MKFVIKYLNEKLFIKVRKYRDVYRTMYNDGDFFCIEIRGKNNIIIYYSLQIKTCSIKAILVFLGTCKFYKLHIFYGQSEVTVIIKKANNFY